MLQAEEPQPSDCLLDYGADDDPDGPFAVSYEHLMAFLDGDEKIFEDTPKVGQSSDCADDEQVSRLQSGNQAMLEPGEDGSQWTYSDYPRTSHDSQGTGLGALFAKETSGSSSQPNTSENFYSGCYDVSEESSFLKDEPYDLPEYYGHQSLEMETNHLTGVSSPMLKMENCVPTPCVATDYLEHRSEYANCTNYEPASGSLHRSRANHVCTFDNYIGGYGRRESTAFDGSFFTSTEPFTAPDSDSSTVPSIITSHDHVLDINVEPGKSCLTNKNSVGVVCNGTFTENADFWSFSSRVSGEPINYKDGRRTQLCNSQALSIQGTSTQIHEEKALADLDSSSPSANYLPNVSFDVGSAESSSVPPTASVNSVVNYQGFKNILQSTNTNISPHFLSREHCCSVSEVTQGNSLHANLPISDDTDICVLEEYSAPTVQSRVSQPRFHSLSKSGYSDYHHPEEIPVWPKTDVERLTFQMALQDLSEPKTEASPPNGVLTVPLLRHQRIALSWMVQKETSGLNCLGGILADDQGLGKTISTIALILSERSPSSKKCNEAAKQVEIEMLNLDEDEEDAVQVNCASHHEDFDAKKTKKLTECEKGSTSSVKGRPPAGTLVVCPTSVLRQWAEELRNKVTSEGNLSFLLYHGSNRTKDPDELSKYDVVLTTYSIVTMEVPKLLALERDDEEKVKSESNAAFPSTKKRKAPPTSKSKDRVDNALVEATARPLARVAWFRVILDEAQTIKNHRTQVAKACCGLRAKRRWCLSGTPIQNAIDDLYSYFRFLRYDPYAVYSSFCSTIKIPISKNPTTGYKKLQAVLKTVMLRRTKGTLLDGQPIILLPPKSVALKKVDFSEVERSFYQRLEAESCEQFKVYAAEGTVKQNYVNILLMLLRLRQACDHPLLVQDYDSESPWKASMESAKKLPWDKRIELLNHLEASLALCTICNDPPEDAAVAICGHVFCNQCVCEHLSGDDKYCPATRCKTKLDAASIFPKSSLSSSLSALQGDGASTVSSTKPVKSELFKDIISSDSSKIKAAIEILQALPKLEGYETTVNPTGSGGQHSLQCAEIGSEKPPVVRTEKAIVFSQWTRMLDLLEHRLKSSTIQYRRLDGTMSVAARDKAVKDFNTIPEVTVMIMSLKAASLGLNLVAASHVLLLDLWWNPTTEDQAIDRAHRIGQTRAVTVSRLTVNDTVEDRILLLQEKKRKMVASAFGEDETGSRQSRLTVEDLKYLFMFSS